MHFWQKSIWFRTASLFFIISLLVFSLVFAVLFRYSSAALEGKVRENAAQKLGLVASSIESTMNGAYAGMYAYSADSAVMFASREELTAYFARFKDVPSELSLLAVLDGEGAVYTSSNNWLYSLRLDVPMYLSLSRVNRLVLMGPHYSALLAARAVGVIRRFTNPANETRVLVGEISSRDLFAQAVAGLSAGETIVALTASGETVYLDPSSPYLKKTATAEGPLDITAQMRGALMGMKGDICEIEADGRRFIAQRADASGFRIHMLTDVTVFNASLASMRDAYLLVAALSVALITLVSAFTSKWVLRPLARMADDMDKMSSDKPGQTAPIHRQDEIGRLLASFQHLMERLYASHQAHMRSEEARYRLEYKVLQSQIQPHFLLNTHVCISALIDKGSFEKAGEMLKYMDSLLRASLDGRETIELSEEAQILVSYMELERIRRPDAPELRLLFAEETLRARVPKLILQPLVENAIRHGLVGLSYPGEITVEAQCISGGLAIAVSDNGRGMSRDRLEQVLRGEAESGRGLISIGVVNVRDRVRRFFGEGSDLSITSREGIGTRVELTLINGGAAADTEESSIS